MYDESVFFKCISARPTTHTQRRQFPFHFILVWGISTDFFPKVFASPWFDTCGAYMISLNGPERKKERKKEKIDEFVGHSNYVGPNPNHADQILLIKAEHTLQKQNPLDIENVRLKRKIKTL